MGGNQTMEDLTGKQLGPYQIIAPLGEGGMASVYKAYQPSMEREVAVKVLPRQYSTSPEYLARFKLEARLLARLQHPHILPVFDFGESDGYTFIAMPMIAGGTLKNLMTGKPMPLERAVLVVSQVGDALDYAHTSGLVHRDIKPSNVLIDDRGNCLLMDFGIARMVEATTRLTQAGGVIGTPIYMSPEQSAGQQIDARSDIYALGVVLFELVTGRAPYNAETPLAVMFKHVNDPLPLPRKLNPALPEAIEHVLLKALAKRPGDRYQSMGEFVRALQRAAQPDTASNLTAAPSAPTRVLDAASAAQLSQGTATHASPSQVLRSLLAGGALLAALAAIAALFSTWIGGTQAAATPTAVQAALSTPGVEISVTPILAAATETALVVAEVPSATPEPPVATEPPVPTEVATLAPEATTEPVEAGAKLFFVETFRGAALDSSWRNLSASPVRPVNGLRLLSTGAEFPYVTSVASIIPDAGDFQLRVRFNYSDLSACGTGILLTTYAPKAAASQAEAEAYQQENEQIGFTAGVWQDATNGMNYWFRSGEQKIEQPVMGGVSDARLHEMVIQRTGNAYGMFLDGRKILTAESAYTPGYLTFGHPARIETCTGYWSSLTISSVQVWTGTPTESQIAGAMTESAQPNGCTIAWFFDPAPNGCLKSVKVRRAELQVHERGRVLYLTDLRRSFVFLDGGGWSDFAGPLDAAATQMQDKLGAITTPKRLWRACTGLSDQNDEATAYVIDPDGRVLSWTARASTGQWLRWAHVDYVTAKGCD